ncbi:Coilin [Merluccius polli]|uniref:Coilin n=1 Tax=Merluccius polli TaxID=89951 RepID=A0AA47NMA5_MERPO|nr:Coilin [Merluccius polli]
MAADSINSIRLRLYFDYPPPAASDCRMCWLLVDLNKCRVVADLESIIRDKFDISRKSILNLFIDNCYLPHTESIYVVRDNDAISIKVDSLVLLTNGQCSDQVGSKSRKKRRRYLEVEPEDHEVCLAWKKKKKKRNKKSEAILDEETQQTPGPIGDEDSHKKHLKRKEKTPKSSSSKTPLTPSGQHVNKTPRPKPVDVNGKAKAKQASSSDSSDSSSEEDTAATNLASKVQKNIPQKVPVAPTGTKVPQKAKPAPGKKSQPCPSSSSSDSSSDEAQGEPSTKLIGRLSAPKGLARDTNNPQGGAQQGSLASQPTKCATKPASGVPPPASVGEVAAGRPADSDSEEEIKLVIKRPLLAMQGVGIAAEACMRGRGWGRCQPRGRGGVNGGNPGRNRVEPPPKRDYSTMPLLAAPPSVGQKIVFKLLELTENYTPEVSEYKEGKIINFDHATKQVELELLNSWHEPGKFDLVYQNADGSESVEYAVSRSGSQVSCPIHCHEWLVQCNLMPKPQPFPNVCLH